LQSAPKNDSAGNPKNLPEKLKNQLGNKISSGKSKSSARKIKHLLEI